MAYLFHMECSYFSHSCGKYYKAAIKRCRLIFEQKIFYYPHRGAQGPVLTNRKGDSGGKDGEFWICRNKMYLIPLHPSLSRILMIPPPLHSSLAVNIPESHHLILKTTWLLLPPYPSTPPPQVMNNNRALSQLTSSHCSLKLHRSAWNGCWGHMLTPGSCLASLPLFFRALSVRISCSFLSISRPNSALSLSLNTLSTKAHASSTRCSNSSKELP